MAFTKRPPKPKFPLGRIVATPAALALMDRCETAFSDLLERHAAGDWGDVSDADRTLNEENLSAGERLHSVYKVGDEEVWLISERDRSVTTILTPSDY